MGWPKGKPRDAETRARIKATMAGRRPSNWTPELATKGRDANVARAAARRCYWPGCGGGHFANGLCQPHDQRRYRQAAMDGTRRWPCSCDMTKPHMCHLGCGTPVKEGSGQSLCITHYARFKKWGDPFYTELYRGPHNHPDHPNKHLPECAPVAWADDDHRRVDLSIRMAEQQQVGGSLYGLQFESMAKRYGWDDDPTMAMTGEEFRADRLRVYREEGVLG